MCFVKIDRESLRRSSCSPWSIHSTLLNPELSTETSLPCPQYHYPLLPHPQHALPGLPTENRQYSKRLLLLLINLPLPPISIHQSRLPSLQLWPTTLSLPGQMPCHNISTFSPHPLHLRFPHHLSITFPPIIHILRLPYILLNPSTFILTLRQTSSSSSLPCLPKSHAPTMPFPPQIQQPIPSQPFHNPHHQIPPLVLLYGALSLLHPVLRLPIPRLPSLSTPATSPPSPSKHIFYGSSNIVRRQTKSFYPFSFILTACLASLPTLRAGPLSSTRTTSTGWSLPALLSPVNSSVMYSIPIRDTPRCVVFL